MFILSLFVLQVLSGSLCNDVEIIKGKVKLGQILKALAKPSEMIDVVLNFLPLDIEGKGSLPKVFPDTAASSVVLKSVKRAFGNREEHQTNKDENTTSVVEDNTTDPLEKFMDHLLKKGTKTLSNIATQIIIDLNIHRNVTPMLEVVTYDYINVMQNYFEFIMKNQNESETNVLYLDMVETSCRLLHNEEKKLLNDIIMYENHHGQGDNFKRIAHKLLRLSKKYRKEVLIYVCEAFQVCREYPAFTDYFADMLSEIFILDDKRFRVILDTLNRILRNEKIFTKIAEKEDIQLITEKLRLYSLDIYVMREVLSVARTVINQRYKTIKSGNEDFKAKTKASSIILDIIDKALHSDDDLLTIDFDNSVQAIRSWSADKRLDISKHLEEFARSFLRRFQHNLTKNAVRELRVLIKIIMRGCTPDDEFEVRLLKSGSKYVKGEDFHPDIDILSI